MNSDQWARVKDIFNAALEREPAARDAFVTEAAAGDDAVRSEVERLINAQHDSVDFIEHSAAATLLSGRVISHYEIGRLIGSGGMGHVYAARDTELGREVAVKVASFDGGEAQARLRREAQHASRLSHPHICHVYDVGRADGQPFVVMELVPGRSLADLVREGPLPIADARRYGMEIADALAHAHEHGVTHRDLKSTNVMITPKRGAKVLDFGLARSLDTNQIGALSHSQRSLTDEGLIAGTLPYMAPELLRGQRGDQRADIWALGVLLYEMAAGRRPFTGSTGFELSAGILHQPPLALPPDVPASMRAIIDRCLQKNPDDRYQHAADVHAALEQMKGPTGAIATRFQKMPRRIAVALAVLAGIAVTSVLAVNGVRSIMQSRVVSNAMGYTALESGEFDEAIDQFETVANRSPEDANAWDSLGEGYLADGRPDKALEAYSRSLTILPTFQASILGRSLALAALGRYNEALEKAPRDFRVHAFLLSRVGRYEEAAAVLNKGVAEDEDAEVGANASLTSAWMSIERKEYAAALERVRAAEKMLADREGHSLLVLADLIGGIAEIRAGNMAGAVARLASGRKRVDRRVPLEANWVAALDGEVALAQGQHDQAVAGFKASQNNAWMILGRDASTVFATNLPSRDGLARVEVARGNRPAAIAEYRRLTSSLATNGSSPVLEPRHVLALARLLKEDAQIAAAHAEYGRFLKLWSRADSGLPELTEAREALTGAP